MARLLLVRHCQSTGQAPGAALTALGQTQARDLVLFLSVFPVDRLVSSPYLRARQSIAPFAEHTGLPLHIDHRLAERTLSAEDIPHWRDVVRRGFEDPDHCEPGGESGRQALDRGFAALNEVRALGCSLPAVVGHGHLFGLILHAIDPSFGFAGHAAMTNPDVFLLEEQGAAWRFTRLWTSVRENGT